MVFVFTLATGLWSNVQPLFKMQAANRMEKYSEGESRPYILEIRHSRGIENKQTLAVSEELCKLMGMMLVNLEYTDCTIK